MVTCSCVGGEGEGKGMQETHEQKWDRKRGTSGGLFPVTHDDFLEIFELIIKESRKHSALVSIIPLLYFSLVSSIIHISCLLPTKPWKRLWRGQETLYTFQVDYRYADQYMVRKLPIPPFKSRYVQTLNMSIHQLYMVFNIKILILWSCSARVMS